MLGAFVAGSYTGTYQAPGDSARSMGLTQEGWRLRWAYSEDDIDETDGYGRGTWIESFYQGINLWIGGIFKEWTLGTIKATLPWQELSTTALGNINLGIVGRAASAIAGAIVLTAVAGTPAASSPASVTVPACKMDKGFNVEPVFGPTHRTLPFLMRVVPTTISSTTRYLTCA